MSPLLLVCVLAMSAHDIGQINTGTKKFCNTTLADITDAAMKVENIGQPHPSGMGIMLPAGVIKKDIFDDVNMNRKTPVRLSLIKMYTSLDMRFRKASSFLACNTCCSVANWISRSSLDDLRQAREVQKAHWMEVQRERVALSTLDAKSRQRPNEIIVLKGDGMSRMGTKLPCIPERAKRITDTSRQTCDIYGWQVARRGTTGHEYCNYFFINPFNSYKCALNFYLSSLIHTLVKVGKVPPIVYLILDSAPVNKSQFIHGSLAYLMLKFPSLEKIVCLHGQVGHTHNSIDGAFGQIRKVIMREELYSPQALAAAASTVGDSESYMPVVYEFKSILTGLLTNIKNRCSQFGFEFTRTNDNVYISGFKNVEDALNEEIEREKIPIFKSKSDMEIVRATILDVIRPCVENVKKSVTKILSTCDKLIPDDEKVLLQEMITDVANMTPGPCNNLFSAVKFVDINEDVTMNDEEEDTNINASLSVQNSLKSKGYHVSARGEYKAMLLMGGDEDESEHEDN